MSVPFYYLFLMLANILDGDNSQSHYNYLHL